MCVCILLIVGILRSEDSSFFASTLKRKILFLDEMCFYRTSLIVSEGLKCFPKLLLNFFFVKCHFL